MKTLLTTIILCLTSLCAFANPETLLLIDKAQKAQKEQSKEAKETWLELAQKLDEQTKSGTKNADIYTMQGNAYLFANKIGMAIYSYSNALKYDASNEEILNNLAYAQSLCVTDLEADPSVSMAESYFYETDFVKDNALWIFIVSWNFIFIVALIKTNISEIKFLWIVSIFFALIFGSALFYGKYMDLTHKQGVVNTSDTIARKGASDIFVAAYKETIKDGTQFSILGKKNNWVHAKLKDGSTCWVSEDKIIEL